MAISAGVTIEFTLLIENMIYIFPGSKSSSADNGENLRFMFNDLELTKKKDGHSSMTSAAFICSRYCRISPEGNMTLDALLDFIMEDYNEHDKDARHMKVHPMNPLQ
ncbi:hypothetical protein Tco_0164541 [Tanacetum coccineum]